MLSVVLALKQKIMKLTYKWEKSNKLRSKIELITFTTTLLISKILSQTC